MEETESSLACLLLFRNPFAPTKVVAKTFDFDFGLLDTTKYFVPAIRFMQAIGAATRRGTDSAEWCVKMRAYLIIS